MSALLVGCVGAYVVTVLIMRRSILTEKVARRGFHVTREYSVDPLELLRVEEVMDKDVQTIPSTMRVSEFVDLLRSGDKKVVRHKGVPIVDAQQRLVGIVTHDDILRAFKDDPNTTVFDIGNKNVKVAFADEVVRDAIDKMLRFKIGRLPVVRREDPAQVIGYLGRPDVFMAWMRRLEEEHKRESLLNLKTFLKTPVRF
jgi:CBS domain-containing protein